MLVAVGDALVVVVVAGVVFVPVTDVVVAVDVAGVLDVELDGVVEDGDAEVSVGVASLVVSSLRGQKE